MDNFWREHLTECYASGQVGDWLSDALDAGIRDSEDGERLVREACYYIMFMEARIIEDGWVDFPATELIEKAQRWTQERYDNVEAK